MRLVVVTNYFPPCFIGGYELGCRDVVERLKARGHTVTILTSDYRRVEAPNEPGVLRKLSLAERKPRPVEHLKNLFIFLRTVFSFSPDVVYFWNQAGLSAWLAPVAKSLGFRNAFFLSDASFESWRIGAFLGRFFVPDSTNRSMTGLKKTISDLLRGSPLMEGWRITRAGRCHFASAFLRDLHAQGDREKKDNQSAVIHWGIEPETFPYAAHGVSTEGPLKLLYVGQIIPEKGVHTAIEATALMLERYGPESVTLTIVGGSSKPEYLAQLEECVAKRALSAQIRFAGKLERTELPGLYRDHDALILPSIWDEPFAITPLEAMSSGLPVVATRTGGSAEIFRHGENSLVFPADDAEACAAAIMSLRGDRALYEAIRDRARDLVLTSFTLNHMVNQIESDLESIALGKTATRR